MPIMAYDFKQPSHCCYRLHVGIIYAVGVFIYGITSVLSVTDFRSGIL
jgi:hypothetical protein